jgi:hypothetical protein
MSELGSSAAAVGIENVEWLDAGAGRLTVRVSGRWRRRRSWVESRGPTALVIEADGRRQRFPATPEPPSLAGAPPGTWRLSFSVPADLVSELRGQVWLALGTVTVALPVPESVPSPKSTLGPETESPPAFAPVPTPDAPSSDAPPSDSASLEIERAWRRAEDAQRSASELGERVSELERALVSERASRERQRPLAGRLSLERDRLLAEDALRARHRAADVRVPAEPAPPPVAAAPARPQSGRPLGGDVITDPSARPPEVEIVAALRRELAGRVAAEAGLRARTVRAEARLAARVVLEQRTAATLAELRDELGLLRDALEHERDRRERAETELGRLRAVVGGQRQRSSDAYAALGELRGALDRLRPPETAQGAALAPGALAPAAPDVIGPATAAGGHPVAPDRLSDALARLRQTTEPREPVAGAELTSASPLAPAPAVASPVAARVGEPTIERPFRVLVRRDPDRGGRLLLGLLGAQRLAYPHPIVYDLVLGTGHGCVQVTVGTGSEVEVRTSGAARAPERVDLQIVGDPARLARLLGSGPLRRLLRLGVARVRGRRDGLAALRALLALPLDLGRLPAGAASPEPEPLLALVGAMIDPAWTAGERFTISHTDERGRIVYLQIRDGRRPLVSLSSPEGRVATTLAGSASELVTTLWAAAEPTPTEAGAPVAGAGTIVEGDRGPLTLVRTWVDRAQAG